MADEQDNYKINFETNAKKAANDSNELAKGLDNVDDATQKVVQSNKSLKAQMKEATVELIQAQNKFGDYSKEALSAAKNLAQLRDKMAEASETANLFDPGKKFQAVAGAVSAMASGFAVAQGAMGLFGAESEEVEKTLLKVQSAMALSQGLSTIADSTKDFQRLKAVVVDAMRSIATAKAVDTVATETSIAVENQSTASKIKSIAVTGIKTAATSVATAAQWLWNTAIMANPIVALVVVVAAAAAGIYAFTKMLMDSSEANDKAAEKTKSLEKELDKESITLAKTGKAVRDKNDHTLAMAKANGDSAESIRKLEKKLIDEQIATDKASTQTARNTFIQERNNLAKLKASDASDEVIKAREKEVQVAWDTFKRENKQLDSSYKERAELSKSHLVEIAKEETDAENKLAEDRKKANEKRLEAQKEAAKKRAEEQKKADKEARKLELEKLKNLQKEYDDVQKIISGSKKANDDSLLTENERKVNAENDAYLAKLEQLKEFNLSTEEIDEEHKRRLDEIEAEYLDEKSEKFKSDDAKRSVSYDKDKAETAALETAKQAVREKGMENLNNIGQQMQALAGKNKAVAKAGLIVEGAVGVAKIVSNTMQAVSEAVKLSPITGGMPFSGIAIASGALSAASQIKAISTGLKALGGGSSPSVPSMGGGSTVSAAAPTVAFNNTAENQIGQSVARTQSEQPALRVTVLESDITNAQTNVIKLTETNTI